MKLRFKRINKRLLMRDTEKIIKESSVSKVDKQDEIIASIVEAKIVDSPKLLSEIIKEDIVTSVVEEKKPVNKNSKKTVYVKRSTENKKEENSVPFNTKDDNTADIENNKKENL